MSDNDTNPFAGILSALGFGNADVRSVDSPEELLAALKSALPPSIVKKAEEMADRIMGGGIPEEVRDFRNRVAGKHEAYHEIGARGENTYTTHPSSVTAVMYDGDNFTEVTEFFRKYNTPYGVVHGKILVDANPASEGLTVLEPGTFIVARTATENNPFNAFTFMNCMQFQMVYELPVSEQADKEFEDDSLTEQEQELDDQKSEREAGLKSWAAHVENDSSDKD